MDAIEVVDFAMSKSSPSTTKCNPCVFIAIGHDTRMGHQLVGFAYHGLGTNPRTRGAPGTLDRSLPIFAIGADNCCATINRVSPEVGQAQIEISVSY